MGRKKEKNLNQYLPLNAVPQRRTHVSDADLQIHVQQLQQTDQLKNIEIIDKLLSHNKESEES